MTDQQEKVAEYFELADPDECLMRACLLAEREYERRRRSVVFATEQAADALDSLLWTFRQNSFVPHGQWQEIEGPVMESVVITSKGPEEVNDSRFRDVLIVVHDGGLPASYKQFERICDFAPSYDECLKKNARERFRACQEAGFRMRFVPAKRD